MFITTLLFLVIFVGLSFLRTSIENRASQEKSAEATEKLFSRFFHITGAIIAIALVFVLIGLAQQSANDLNSYGIALLLAVSLSLIAGGEPQTYMCPSRKKVVREQDELQYKKGRT